MNGSFYSTRTENGAHLSFIISTLSRCLHLMRTSTLFLHYLPLLMALLEENKNMVTCLHLHLR